MTIYRCQLCGYEENVEGSALDGPIFIHSKVLNVTVRYSSSLVKNMAEAETRHVMKMHRPGDQNTPKEKSR